MEWRDWLIIIPIYWIILFFMITLIISDPTIGELEQEHQFVNLSNRESALYNLTNADITGNTSASDVLNTFGMIFFFKNPVNSNFPYIITFLLSFIDWLSIIIFALAIYRTLNPFA